MVQNKVVLSLALMAMLLLVPLHITVNVQAGDVNNPEIIDYEGDTKSGKASKDVLWGYMGHETNSTFAVVIGVSALETFTDPSQIKNFPITDYEFYFSVKGVNYAAVATVPIHGPFGIEIRYELRTVEYNGSTPSVETQKTSITTASYTPVDGIINMTIDKSDVGGVEKEDRAENLWIATYSRQREGQFNISAPALEDRAPDDGYGQPYVFRGSPGAQVYKLDIESVSERTFNLTAFASKKIEISVFNNGTSRVQVHMNNTTTSKLSISWSLESLSLDPLRGNNVTLQVKIKDIKKVTDGETVPLQVWAEANIGNETVTKWKPSNSLTFTVKISAPKPPPQKKTQWEEFRDTLTKSFKDNRNMWIGAIGGIIALVIVAVVVAKLKGGNKKKEEFEDLEVDTKPPPPLEDEPEED